jgi:hypothetical protein
LSKNHLNNSFIIFKQIFITMKKTLCLFLLFAIGVVAVNAQTYKKVKVMLNNGLTIKGSNASINNGSVSMSIAGKPQTYSLTDISLIQAKSGKGDSWAAGCGGGCLGYCLVSGLISGVDGIEETGSTVGSYIASSILCAGVSAGVGYLIGSLLDSYEIVYNRNLSSYMDNFQLGFSACRQDKTTPEMKMVTLTYNF